MSKLLKNIVGNIKRPARLVILLICCCAAGITFLATRYMTQAPLSPDVLVTLDGKPFVTTEIVSKRIEMEKKTFFGPTMVRQYAMRIFDTTCLSMLTDEWLQQHPEHMKNFFCEDCKNSPLLKDVPSKDYMKHIQNSLSRIDEIKRYEYQLELDYDKSTYFMKNALKPSTPQESFNRSHGCPGHSRLLEYLDEIREIFDIKVIKEHLIRFLERYPGSFDCIPQLAPPLIKEGLAAPFLPKPALIGAP